MLNFQGRFSAIGFTSSCNFCFIKLELIWLFQIFIGYISVYIMYVCSCDMQYSLFWGVELRLIIIFWSFKNYCTFTFNQRATQGNTKAYVRNVLSHLYFRTLKLQVLLMPSDWFVFLGIRFLWAKGHRRINGQAAPCCCSLNLVAACPGFSAPGFSWSTLAGDGDLWNPNSGAEWLALRLRL